MKILSTSLIYLIRFYRYFISPYFPLSCRYLPTCSEYCVDSIKLNGTAKGLVLSVKRILKCHPIKFLGGGSGVDPAPNLKRRKK